MREAIATAEDKQFDPEYLSSVGREVIEPLAQYYFRLKMVGLENIPLPVGNRPLIFVANHAGRTFPWDAVLLDYGLGKHWIDTLGYEAGARPRPLAAPELTTSKRLLPFRLQNWWHRVGCIDATALNFSRLLRQNRSVIIFPEGIPGIARDFKYRYQLLPFPSPLVRLAKQYDALIVPVAIIGSEYYHPYARKTRWLQAIAKKLGLPFISLSPFSVLLPVLPWLFYGALPAPTTIVIGQPLEPQTATAEQSWEDLSEQLRQQCQTLINESRAHYEKGWDLWGLLKTWRTAPEPFWRLLPTYWPRRFIRNAQEKATHLFPNIYPDWWFWLPVVGWFSYRKRHTANFEPRPIRRRAYLATAVLQILLARLAKF